MSRASHVDVKNPSSDVPGLYAAARAIEDNQLSVDSYVAACLRRIGSVEAGARAFAQCDREYAQKRAYVFDRMPADKRGPIHGLPCAAAEVIDVKGMPGASWVPRHAGHVAKDDAAVVTQARAAGAIVIGTTATAEFSCFGSGTARNPFATDRSSGGSGAAAAVASGMVPLAFDVRADGAIAVPASFCGVHGLKVTRGALSGKGLYALAPSVVGTGFYVRDAVDVGFAASLFLDLQAFPERCHRYVHEVEGLSVHLMDSASGYRIQPAARSAVNRAITALSDQRVDIVRARLPAGFVKAEGCYNTIFGYEVAQRLARDRDRFSEDIGTTARARIDQGRRIGADAYEQARRDAIAMRSELLDLLTDDAVFLDVAAEGVAPSLEADSGWSPTQALWALSGVPTLAVPCGEVDGLPIGIQIVAGPGREDLLARVACLIEDRIAR